MWTNHILAEDTTETMGVVEEHKYPDNPYKRYINEYRSKPEQAKREKPLHEFKGFKNPKDDMWVPYVKDPSLFERQFNTPI